MTPAEKQTADVLLVDATFLAAIGTNSNGTVKLFPSEIPDDTALPAGTYERGDTDTEYTLDNEIAAARVSMNVVIWAKTAKQANDIALAVTVAMGAAGHAQTGASNQYEPEMDEYAALRVFDVWEI